MTDSDGIDPIWDTLLNFPADPPVAQAAREIPPLLEVIPFGITGLVWLIVYILIIRQGLRDKRVGMPVLAVGSNIAWEFTYAFMFPQPPVLQIASLLWFVIDVIILVQVFRYGRKDFPGFSARAFGWTLAGWLTFTFSFMILATYELADTRGGYATFFVVPFMQMMFVITLRIRRSTAGQSMYIAVLKLIGDVPGFIVLMAWFPNRYLFVLLFITEIFFDILYIVMLRGQYAAEGRPLWRSAPKQSGVASHEHAPQPA